MMNLMTIHEIRVTPIDADPVGHEVLHEAQRTLGVKRLESVQTAKVYRLQGVTKSQAQILAERLFTDPVNEKYFLDKPVGFDSSHIVEVAYKPGVMNPQVASILKAAQDLGIELEAADASVEYAFSGKVSSKEVEDIVHRLLMNKTVEQVVTEKPAYGKWHMGPGMIIATPEPDKVLAEAKLQGITAQVIGEVTSKPGIRIANRAANRDADWLTF